MTNNHFFLYLFHFQQIRSATITILRDATPEETAAWLGGVRVIFGAKHPKSFAQNSHLETQKSDPVNERDWR